MKNGRRARERRGTAQWVAYSDFDSIMFRSGTPASVSNAILGRVRRLMHASVRGYFRAP